MEPKQRVEDLIVICGRLADVLEKENGALRDQRTTDLRDLQEPKGTLSRAYESRMAGLAGKPEQLTEVDFSLREKLMGLGERLTGLMVENERLLRVAMESHRRVVDVIAEAVKTVQPGPGTYSQGGVVGAPTGRGGAKGTPLTINEAL